eukprot:TRINITY_DN1733_c0_g1_i8.p1 TRINITY_DN1733_c0_g1~~TRINITY_DN1733_c0_g1_i8.p1  ORF type:complete len:935 (-),score=38.42 TRINITY_DN1733_c0_g1_i8:21-2825(-)
MNVSDALNQLTIWGANVCSLSGNSQASYERRIRLQLLINSVHPDVVVLVETNLENDWNPLPNLYDSFRTCNNKAGGVLILAKKELNPFQLNTWENHGLMVNCIPAKLSIIGMYTPYYKTLNASKKILDSWTKKGRWLVFADNERWISEEAKRGQYQFIPDWSRLRNGKYYVTDGFYGNVQIHGEGLGIISDHRILQCKTSLSVKLRIQQKGTWSRSRIIFWAINQSKFRNELLQYWPEICMIKLIKKWIKPKDLNRFIWASNMSSTPADLLYKQWKTKQRSKLFKKIDLLVETTNLEGLAKSMRRLLKLTKSSPFPKGVTTNNGDIILGEEANKMYADFYRELYTAKTSLSPVGLEQNKGCIKIDAENVKKRLSQGKAMSLDMCPDELLQDPCIFANLIEWCKKVANGSSIPTLYKTGRLLLLSKINSITPKVFETRPIIILSIVFKCLEAIWAIKYEDLIWSNIGKWQVGFRKEHSTQELISKLKLWLIKHRSSGIVIFVDVRKAFDSIERSQVIETLKELYMDEDGIRMYKNLVSNLKVYYNDELIAYDRGVPQGSLLSPMLFNLVYDKLLKEAHRKGWKIFAFADDLAICLTSQKQYLEAITWLKTWKSKVYLSINDDKTKEMRLGRLKGKYHEFEVVSSYKYLGVIVHDGAWKKLSKKRCREIITTNLQLKVPWMNYGASRLAIFWWLIAGILYHLVSEVVIGNLDTPYIEKYCLKAIRKATKCPNFVSNKLLKEFYQLDIASTLERMTEKIRMNIKIQGCVRPKIYNKSSHIWIQATKISRLSPSQVATWIRNSVWRKGRLLKCKLCGENLTTLHVSKHCEVLEATKLFLEGLRENGINLTISKLNLTVDKLKMIIEEGKKLLDLISEFEVKTNDEDRRYSDWTACELNEIFGRTDKEQHSTFMKKIGRVYKQLLMTSPKVVKVLGHID